MRRQVPKQATDLIARRQREWRQSLPPILKMEMLKGKEKTRIKKEFLRSGVDWIWDKPIPISWSYYMSIPGRRSDRKPRIKAQRIAEAMETMPRLIAEYREERRQFRLQKKTEKIEIYERDQLINAASTRLTDMRELVKQFDTFDDSFFDGDNNYYQLLNDNDNDKHESIDNNNITQWRKIEKRRKYRSLQFAEMLKTKPLLSSELDSIQEKLDKSREYEKINPEDGDYNDGRTWNRRRSEKELAYIQQLANEPNLEKEEEKHSKRRVK